MGDERLTSFLEGSFLSPLLENEDINDISYNGAFLFYEDRLLGRVKAPIYKTSREVGDFLRQIANLAEKQFSYSVPILDVSFSKYRLNAAFLNLVRVGGEKSYSFSLRIGKQGSAINDESLFFDDESKKILLDAIEEKESIIIGGSTSSGKTELQKYLISKMKDNTRIIIIDAAKELENIRVNEDLDLTSWMVDERFPDSTFSSLIKNALRNDPDYIIIAESRGEEMNDALNSAMTGHPLILTLHASNVHEMPSRIARMVSMGEKRLTRGEILEDVYGNFPLYVHLSKIIMPDGSIFRYLDSIGRVNKEKDGIDIIYERSKK